MFQYIKALHIIFVVTWFAGLFYIVRLFIYHVEAAEKPEPEKNILQQQYKLMEKRLWYGITWPSAILTLIFGGALLIDRYSNGIPSWLWVKLGFVVLLFAYHIVTGLIFYNLKNDIVKYTSGRLRIWNEVATLLLVSIVFLVVLRSTLSLVWGITGFVVFAIMLMLAIRIYKGYRKDSV